MASLTALANAAGTNKGTDSPFGRGMGTDYADIYEGYLSPLRHEPITLLEIGLGVPGPNWRVHMAVGNNEGGGGSLRMWYRYFSRARILGIDVNPAGHLDNDRITTGVADQSDPDQLLGFLREAGVEALDVVVDDGSHQPEHQQIAFSVLLPLVRPGGLYFIEDLYDNGVGDEHLTRTASSRVLSTRRVLKGFEQTGAFAAPHALVDPAGLGALVGQIAFHRAPVVAELPSLPFRARLKAAAGILRGDEPPGTRCRYLADKEMLGVVRRAW